MIGFDLHGGEAPAFVLRAIAQERLIMNATGPQTVRLLPPLTLTDDEAADAVARIGRMLA